MSHETIYRSLFVQARGVLKKELLSHLRSKPSMRRSRPVDPNGDRRGHIKDIVSIRQRPAAVEDRAVPGHWEGDLLSGPNNTYIATLVERQTRYVMLAKVAGKDTQTVVTALIKQAKKLPKELYKSLTWDRGKELTDHRRFTLATNIDVYFCDPQSPWQRGSNENTNGLLRQYFPKGTDLSVHSQAHLNKVARQLNERPRETLQFETPAERFNACVASTSGVLAADIAGYSRLMGRDEEGTLSQLKAFRKTLIDPTIAAHRGRIVKTTGDGMLVEFASAVDAARCAVEVQRGVAGQNAGVPLNVRIEFRIGIHVGDIIFDDNDIFGDGVNIAARLEGIAEPGGICISDDAQRQIRGKLDSPLLKIWDHKT